MSPHQWVQKAMKVDFKVNGMKQNRERKNAASPKIPLSSVAKTQLRETSPRPGPAITKPPLHFNKTQTAVIPAIPSSPRQRQRPTTALTVNSATTVIGEYLVGRQLGVGAYATVKLATDRVS